MELAEQALGSLLPKLGTLLSDEYKLQKGVRGEVKFLQAEMESMQAVLNMLSKQPPHQISDLDKIWVRDLKELSYDIEDSVDTFMVCIDNPVRGKPHGFRRFLDRTIGLLTTANTRHHVANDIQDIKRRISEVAGRRGRYRFEGSAERPELASVDPRVLACFEHTTKLVGTDGPIEEISNLLTKGKGAHKRKPMVVSIVGVGGLGKTTIANLVYERFEGQFNCQAFISVSLRPNMKQILSSLLRQITKDKCTNAGEKYCDELIRTIRQFLKDRRYFIVIDDVWSEEAWKTIEGALIDNNLGSKVVITTRNLDVANLSSADGVMYELDPLSYKDSERLLSKRVFNEEEGILSELEEVTMHILKKCGGIPLAIITIASMLASKPKSKYEWYSVYKSIVFGLENDKSLGKMREILHLSYSDLPSYLKPCLLHLSVFPEDSEIQKNELIQLWVAEGFVDQYKGSNLYDLGERYFNELVNRSMIQPVDMNEFGSARACRVHDMILDLIIFLLNQENFVTISEYLHLIPPECKIRRLSLRGRDAANNDGGSKDTKVIPHMANTSHVRTLVALGNAFQWMPPLSSFPVLRVLILKYFPKNRNYLKGLESLHHLRYLKLRCDDVETGHLEEIGNLKNLKTLDLKSTRIIKLPESIVRLRQLECLITAGGVKFPDGIGNLVSLQQLGVLDVGRSPQTLVELGNLVGIRVLTISGFYENDESCVKTFLQGLSNLHNIHTLNIVNGGSLDCKQDQWSAPAHLQCFNARDSSISNLPLWFSSLSELCCLSILVNMLRQDDLQLLGALPMLRFLDLSIVPNGTTEEWLVIGPNQPFRSLTDFRFEHYARCWLVFAQGVMPKLQRLELYFMHLKRGGCFDVGLDNLSSLKQVKVKLNCYDARMWEVEDAETKWRDTIDKHPNHPTLELSRQFEWTIIVDENKTNSEASEQQCLDLLTNDDERNNGSETSEQSCFGISGSPQ